MKLIEAAGVTFDAFAGRRFTDNGWCGSWGNPEIYKFFLPRIKPGHRMLDLGYGLGRNSHRLSMAGVCVVGVDNSSDNFSNSLEIRNEAGINHSVVLSDGWEYLASHGRGFDYIFAIDLLLHLGKGIAIQKLEDLVSSMKRGAFLYVNVPSTLAPEYDFAKMCFPEVERDTFEMECGCSGSIKLEPVCFFEPFELESHLTRLGTKIRYIKLGGDYDDQPIKSCVITEKI